MNKQRRGVGSASTQPRMAPTADDSLAVEAYGPRGAAMRRTVVTATNPPGGYVKPKFGNPVEQIKSWMGKKPSAESR